MGNPMLFTIKDLRPHRDSPAKYDFSVVLDRDFALRCAERTIDADLIDRLNSIGGEVITDVLGPNSLYSRPYVFVGGNRLLVNQFSFGNDGRWLVAPSDIARLRNENMPLVFDSHNVDSPTHAYALLSLFSTWKDYAEAIIGE